MLSLIPLASQATLNGPVRRLLLCARSLPLLAAIALSGLASSPQSAMAAGLTITTTTLPAGYVGSAYSTTLAASGGSGTGYTWSISAGTLPAGLTLTSGVIAGKPTTAATTGFTIKVTDSAANTATAAVSIKVNPALTVSTTKLAAGYVGSAYSAALAASGGTGTGYSWSISTGALPAGLTLTPATGAISGKPTTAATTAFTVKVTDSAAHTATASLSITVGKALAVSTTKLAAGYVGSAYSAALAASGGTGTGYSWSISTGALPAGLTLTPATGAISGKPTTAATTAFTVKVTDSAAHTATASLSITVDKALAVSTTKLATGYLNLAYSATLAATGGTGTGYKWTITAGTLPTGLSLAAATGVISGKPTVKGSNALTFKVTDSLAHAATANLTIAVNADLSITTTKLGVGYVSSKYSAKLVAAGGSGTGESWSLLSGTLPAGITLSSAGLLAGTPSASGVSSFSVEVKDSALNTATMALTLTVDPGLTITSNPSLPVGYLGSGYSATLTASGGSAAGYKWTATNTLPQGLTLSSAGVLSGTPAVIATSIIDVKVVDSVSNTATAALTLLVDPIVSTCTNDQQSTALVELHGVYTFQFSRFNLANNSRSWSIGSFNADGLGNIVNGVMDTNGPEFPAEAQSTFTGAYTVGSDGRGRMDLATTGTSQTSTFCFALDTFSSSGNAAHAAIIEDDKTNNVVSGELYQQSANPTLASIKGTWIVGMAGRLHTPYGGQDFRDTVAGYITLDGAGNVTQGEVDQNLGSIGVGRVATNVYKAKTLIAGAYTMPVPASGTPTGRGTIRVASTGQAYRNFVLYPAGASYIALLEVDPPDPAGGPLAPVLAGGCFKRSGTTFSTATGLLGSSVISQNFVANVGKTNESSGVGINVTVWDGAGNFSYTGDMSSNGSATTTSGTGTYTVDSNGRFAVMIGGVCSPCGYLTKTDVGVAIYDSTDGGLAILEQQVVPLGGSFQISSFQGGYSVGTRWFDFPDQMDVSGELVSLGAGTISGTLDENQQGNAQIDQTTVDSETATPTSGVHGRFLLSNHNGSSNSAFYIVNPKEALSIEIGGSGSLTQPLTQYHHQ